MVLMQPYCRLEKPSVQPFRWDEKFIERQSERITRTLELAKHPDNKAHFTLIPEYSVPGIDGARHVYDTVAADSWHVNSVLVAGVDGLTRDEFAELLDSLHPENEADLTGCVSEHEWVNCSLTIVKEASRCVRTWIQPKIAPAELEQFTAADSMYQGTGINLFACKFDNDTPCHFASLLCFDWVGRVQGCSVREAFLNELNTLWGGTRQPLHWMFVLQHNEAPNHYTFIDSTKQFLSNPLECPCASIGEMRLS